MNIPGLQIFNPHNWCSPVYLRSDHRRQLGYFQSNVTRNSADHKPRDKINPTQNAPWTEHKMFHSSFTLLRWVPWESEGCSWDSNWQKRDWRHVYRKNFVCIHNIYIYLYKHLSLKVIGPWLKTPAFEYPDNLFTYHLLELQPSTHPPLQIPTPPPP